METKKELRAIIVTYSDGSVIPTNMSANLTDEQMLDYFAIGRLFNIGVLKDKMATVVSREIIK